MMFEPITPFRTSEFQVKFATSDWERREAHALRRAVFCKEQKIFEKDDRDAIDDHAIPIVALSCWALSLTRWSALSGFTKLNLACGGARGWQSMRISARSGRSARR